MAEKQQQGSEASKEEQIGFHKGALSTLAKEREEMQKIVQVVEQLMQMHVKALKDLGVDLAKEAEKAKSQSGQAQQGSGQTGQAADNKPIEDILK